MKLKHLGILAVLLVATSAMYWSCTSSSGSGLLIGGAPCIQDSACSSSLCIGAPTAGTCEIIEEEGCVTQVGVNYCGSVGGGACDSTTECPGGGECEFEASGTCSTCVYASDLTSTDSAEDVLTTQNNRCASRICETDDNSARYGQCLECRVDSDCGTTGACIDNVCAACNHLSQDKDNQCPGDEICTDADTCIALEECDENLGDFCSEGLSCQSGVCR